MEPFFFGSSGRKLFGVYHRSLQERHPSAGVVICQPTGQEYVRSHRALLRLAVLLSSAGFHVLRFDFSCCGDSEGAFEDARLRYWIEDADAAVTELRDGCAVDRICLCGLRIGASVAMLVGAKRGDVDCMALWEPVVDGGTHVAELVSAHRAWLRGSFAKPRPRRNSEPACEIFGFAFSDALLDDIRSIDCLSIRSKPAREIFIIESAGVAVGADCVGALERLGVSPAIEAFAGTEVWIKREEELDKSLVPLPLLQRLVSWFSETVR